MDPTEKTLNTCPDKGKACPTTQAITMDPEEKTQNKAITVICHFCKDRFICEPDGTLRYCKCKKIGIDHTSSYTRVLGTMNFEDFQVLNSSWLKPIPNKS